MKKEKYPYLNREISWLHFNERVLQEAQSTDNHILNKLRFLGIFSNNRDEFFRVRVATIKRMVSFGKKATALTGIPPRKLLEEIQSIILKQNRRYERVYKELIKELEQKNIFLLDETKLSSIQKKFVVELYRNNVQPALVPIIIDEKNKFPYLKDKAIYLFVKLNPDDKKEKVKYSILEIPVGKISRFVLLPAIGTKKFFIFLDDVIRYNLADIFSIFNCKNIEAYTIKMTRDAELDLEQDVSVSMEEKISKSIKKRSRGQPVRLVYDNSIPSDAYNFLIKKLKLKPEDSPLPGGRYHNFKDFMNFPNIFSDYQSSNQLQPRKLMQKSESIFSIIKDRDLLLAFPYQSYNHVIDMLREAAIDPQVKYIYITLYRVADQSNIVNALINAIKNGKQVLAVVEPQARFDEEANIFWANRLQEEGAKIIYGVQGLKVHSKLLLIGKKNRHRIKWYAHIGTGNFNENTAKIYCDLSFFTTNHKITSEVFTMFEFFRNNLKIGEYKELLVAPFFMKKKILELIEKEVSNAKKGFRTGIYIKLNNLEDKDIIDALYRASQNGVKIKLIIRSICCLISGRTKLSENIEARSIVDQYLEHARLLIFENAGNPKYFISSADLMSRNLDFRSEVAVPIYDKQIQKTLQAYFDIQWQDNIKSRSLDDGKINHYISNKKNSILSQTVLYQYFPASVNDFKP